MANLMRYCGIVIIFLACLASVFKASPTPANGRTGLGMCVTHGKVIANLLNSTHHLFKFDTVINELTNDNFDDFMANHINDSRLVLFYSSYCPHCRNYAPTFVAVSRLVANTGLLSSMAIGAVDCPFSPAPCKVHNITAYPTLRFYSNDGSVKSVFKNKYNPDSLVVELATLMNKTKLPTPRHIEGTPQIVIKYPKGRDVTIKALSMEIDHHLQLSAANGNVVSIPRDDTDKTISISLSDANELGQSALLAIDELDPIKRGPCVGQRTNVLEVIDSLLRHEVQIFDTQTDDDAVSEEDEVSDEHGELIASAADINRRRYTTYLKDIELALMISLEREVAVQRVIRGDSLATLVAYMETLIDFFPATMPVHTFLLHLECWIMERIELETVRGSELASFIRDYKANNNGVFNDGDETFIACRGSEPIYGGYTCAFWMMWHVMTLSEYDQRVAKKHDHVRPSVKRKQMLDVETVDDGLSSQQHLIKTFVNFIRYFFTCKECSGHFMRLSNFGDDIVDEVDTPQGGILWLWQRHNQVSIRLAAEGGSNEDPKFPKAVFPDREHCVNCYPSDMDLSVAPRLDELLTDQKIRIVNALAMMYRDGKLNWQDMQAKHNRKLHHHHPAARQAQLQGDCHQPVDRIHSTFPSRRSIRDETAGSVDGTTAYLRHKTDTLLVSLTDVNFYMDIAVKLAIVFILTSLGGSLRRNLRKRT